MRDWKRIESELDELLPSGSEVEGSSARDQASRPIRSPNDDSSILKHIADALRRGKVEHS